MKNARKCRLLYADDTASDRDYFAGHFNALPEFTVETCDLSPFAIKQRIRGGNADVLILDVRYDQGGKAGAEVQADFGVRILDDLAEELKRAGIVVILHSVQDLGAPGSDVARAMAEAMDRHGPEGSGLIPELGYIAKPLQPKQAETILRMLLNHHRDKSS